MGDGLEKSRLVKNGATRGVGKHRNTNCDHTKLRLTTLWQQSLTQSCWKLNTNTTTDLYLVLRRHLWSQCCWPWTRRNLSANFRQRNLQSKKGLAEERRRKKIARQEAQWADAAFKHNIRAVREKDRRILTGVKVTEGTVCLPSHRKAAAAAKKDDKKTRWALRSWNRRREIVLAKIQPQWNNCWPAWSSLSSLCVLTWFGICRNCS